MRYFFFSFFFFISCSIAEDAYFSLEMPEWVCSQEFSYEGDANSNDPNSYTLYQSPNGNAHATVSIKENDFLPRIEPRQTSFAQQNYRVIKNYSHGDWSKYFASRRGNIIPINWLEESRVELFAEFELWEHKGYRNLLKSFPEYSRMIVRIDELSKKDIELQNILNNCCVERGWFSDTKLKDFIKKELPEAKRIVVEEKKEEERRLKRELEKRDREERDRLVQLERNKKHQDAQKVQQVFLEQEERLEEIAVAFFEEAEFEASQDYGKESFHSKWYQRRAEAVQKAVNEGFKIEYKEYVVSDRTRALLKKQGMGSALFDQCTGNAIQQEIHSEFVEVLNESADLSTIDLAFDKETWFFTMGGLSGIGCECNNAGQFDLAYQFSNFCKEMYEDAKYFLSECKNKTYAAGRGVWKGGKRVVSFVKKLKDDPKKTLYDIGKSIAQTARTMFEMRARLKYMDSIPLDKMDVLEKNLEEFHEDFGWFKEHVDKTFDDFMALSTDQKIEEIFAAMTEGYIYSKAFQFGGKCFRRIKKGVPKFSKRLKKFSEKFGKKLRGEGYVGVTPEGIPIEIPPGQDFKPGTYFMEREVPKKVFRGIFGSAAQQVEENVDIWHRTESLNGPVNEWVLEAARKLKKNHGFCSKEFLELVEEGRPIIKGKSVIKSITNIGITQEEAKRLKDLFIETLGGQKTLAKLGLQDAVIDETFIAHFTSPEMKTILNRSGREWKKLVGCHVYDPALEVNGAVTFDLAKGSDLVETAKISCNGVLKKTDSTLFPLDWAKEKAVVEVAQSIMDSGIVISKKGVIKGIESEMSGGIRIVTYLKNKRFVTSYPGSLS